MQLASSSSSSSSTNFIATQVLNKTSGPQVCSWWHPHHKIITIKVSEYLYSSLLPNNRLLLLWLLLCMLDNLTRVQQRQRVYYSASALLAMQSAVLARGILSVYPSVTFRYCVQMNEDTIMRLSASGRTIHLVSEEVKFIRIFAGDHSQRGRQSEALPCR